MRSGTQNGFSEAEEAFFRAGEQVGTIQGDFMDDDEVAGMWSDFEPPPPQPSLWSRLFRRARPGTETLELDDIEIEPRMVAIPPPRRAPSVLDEDDWDWQIAIARARAATSPGV